MGYFKMFEVRLLKIGSSYFMIQTMVDPNLYIAIIYD